MRSVAIFGHSATRGFEFSLFRWRGAAFPPATKAHRWAALSKLVFDLPCILALHVVLRQHLVN